MSDQPSIPGVSLASLSGSGLTDLDGGDAMTTLANALVSTQTQLNSASLREVIFIYAYTGDWGRRFVAEILALKPHQATGMAKKYRESLSALALEQFMKQVNLNLGGK